MREWWWHAWRQLQAVLTEKPESFAGLPEHLQGFAGLPDEHQPKTLVERPGEKCSAKTYAELTGEAIWCNKPAGHSGRHVSETDSDLTRVEWSE